MPKRKSNKNKNKRKSRKEVDGIDKVYCSENITLLNNELARLRSLKSTVSDMCLNVTEELLKFENDRNDVAEKLEKDKIHQIYLLDDLTKKLKEIEDLRQHNIQEFNEMLTDLEEKYVDMQKYLMTDLQILSTNLAALNAERLNMQKLYGLSLMQMENSVSHEQLLNIEFKKAQNATVISCDNIRAGLDAYIVNICDGMKEAIKNSNKAVSSKVIARNYKLNNQITQIIKKESDLYKKYHERKTFIDDFKLQIVAINEINEILENKLNRRTNKWNRYLSEIEKKKMEYCRDVKQKTFFQAKRKFVEKRNLHIQNMREKIEKYHKKTLEAEENIAQLKNEVKISEKVHEEANEFLNQISNQIDNILNTEDLIKMKMKESVDFNTDNLKYLKLQRRHLLFQLNEIIAGCSDSLPSLSKEFEMYFDKSEDCKYQRGNLGFVKLQKSTALKCESTESSKASHEKIKDELKSNAEMPSNATLKTTAKKPTYKLHKYKIGERKFK